MEPESLEGDWRQASSSEQGDQGDEEEQAVSPQKTPGPGPLQTRSCDTCKRMKIKCERRGDRCLHCIERDTECETTLVARKKRPKRPLPESLSALEDRIKRLESVLTLSGIDQHQPPVPDIAGGNAEIPQDLNDKLSDLLIDDSGGSRFIGASSGFTLFSPHGLRWISEKTGSNELSELISSFGKRTDGPWAKSKLDIWHPMPLSEREPLPSKELAELFVQHFFDDFNTIFPLYNRASFDELIQFQFSGQPRGGIEWYTSLNVVLCLGSMIVRQKGPDGSRNCGPVDERRSWGYFRNACSCFIDLMFRGCNLMALQAICGLAFIHQMFWDPQNIYVLTAAAGRLAYAIGLHRKMDSFGFSPEELQQRCNVFWIVYVMDKTIATRLGHPSIMIDDDIGIDLPRPGNLANDHPDGSKRYNMFRCHAELAQLESRVYSELYSVRAQSKPMVTRLASVGQLDKALQEWRLALPLEIRPGEVIECAEEQVLPVSMMHFAYFYCLTTIHRSSIHHGSWTTDGARQKEVTPQDPNLNPRVYASQSICLTAARKSIELLRMLNAKERSGKSNLTWMALYYPISSFLTLFANTLQNPQSANADSDLELMDVVLYQMNIISTRDQPFAGGQAGNLFVELGRVASSFVERNKGYARKPKRVYSNPEVVIPERRSCSSNTNTGDSSYYQKYNSTSQDSQIQTARKPSSQFQTAAMSTTLPLTPAPHQHFLDHSHPDQPLNFENIMLSLPDEPEFPPQDLYLNSQAPIYTGYIEWDLANLWYGVPTNGY